MILGIDVSLASSGYGVVDNEGNLIHYGKVRTEKKDFKTENDRINHIANIFKNIVDKYNITDVLMEDAFIGNNAAGGMALKKLQGALIRTFKDLDNCCTITVASWRKLLLKSKKAVKKEDVFEYVRKNIIDIGEVITEGAKKNDDVYEGIAISKTYHCNKEDIIESNLYKTKKKPKTKKKK
ncbi:MAG: crossover junction endodeoxyribonuclease RuvC [Sarcina sp.]